MPIPFREDCVFDKVQTEQEIIRTYDELGVLINHSAIYSSHVCEDTVKFMIELLPCVGHI